MANHTHNGFTYEPLDTELHEIDRSRYAEAPSFEASRTSSHFSGLTRLIRADDDKQSLISHRKSSASGHVFDNATEDCGEHPRPSRKKRYRFKSWKIGVMAAATMTTTVLLVNIVLTIWASATFGLEGGIGTAYDGDCDITSAWSFWLHILINILSSILLSASNYTMQCVTAPTRRECDRAHSRGDWLDVGVPSVRNLLRIDWPRRTMWALLALSSTPIHLLYNSAVFKTLDNNSYQPYLVSREFLQSNFTLLPAEIIANATSSSEYISSYPSQLRTRINSIMTLHQDYVDDPSSFKNLTSKSCIETYATWYLSGHGNLFLVTDISDPSMVPHLPPSPKDRIGNAGIPFDWMCPQGIKYCKNPAEAKKISTEGGWTLGDKTIDYCLSQDRPQHCKLQFSTYILIAVIICNMAKSVTMLWVLKRQRETTFITFGDAIASWLEKPDQETTERCFESVRSIVRRPKGRHSPWPRLLDQKARRWRLGVSKRRWIAVISVLVIGVLVSSACFGGTVAQMHRSTADTMVSLGFGAVNSNMLLNANLPEEGASGLTSSVLFANFPQVVLSFVYLSLNALVTCMLLAHEYSGYEIHRKPLRVTTPYGQQRSTYWLQIPFTYGIPLIATSAILHWLISQAVFLVRVEDYGYKVSYSNSISAVGLSPAPMLVVVILGVCITAAAIGMGFRKLRGSSMPVAASCSLAMAAAAHRPAGDVDAAVLPVKQGGQQVSPNKPA